MRGSIFLFGIMVLTVLVGIVGATEVRVATDFYNAPTAVIIAQGVITAQETLTTVPVVELETNQVAANAEPSRQGIPYTEDSQATTDANQLEPASPFTTASEDVAGVSVTSEMPTIVVAVPVIPIEEVPLTQTIPSQTITIEPSPEYLANQVTPESLAVMEIPLHQGVIVADIDNVVAVSQNSQPQNSGNGGGTPGCNGKGYLLYQTSTIDSTYSIKLTGLYGTFLYFEVLKDNKIVASESAMFGSKVTVHDKGNSIGVTVCSANSQEAMLDISVSYSQTPSVPQLPEEPMKPGKVPDTAKAQDNSASSKCKGKEYSLYNTYDIDKTYSISFDGKYGTFLYFTLYKNGKEYVVSESVQINSEVYVSDGKNKIVVKFCSVSSNTVFVDMYVNYAPEEPKPQPPKPQPPSCPGAQVSVGDSVKIDDNYSLYITGIYAEVAGDYVYFDIVYQGNTVGNNYAGVGAPITTTHNNNEVTVSVCHIDIQTKSVLLDVYIKYNQGTVPPQPPTPPVCPGTNFSLLTPVYFDAIYGVNLTSVASDYATFDVIKSGIVVQTITVQVGSASHMYFDNDSVTIELCSTDTTSNTTVADVRISYGPTSTPPTQPSAPSCTGDLFRFGIVSVVTDEYSVNMTDVSAGSATFDVIDFGTIIYTVNVSLGSASHMYTKNDSISIELCAVNTSAKTADADVRINSLNSGNGNSSTTTGNSSSGNSSSPNNSTNSTSSTNSSSTNNNSSNNSGSGSSSGSSSSSTSGSGSGGSSGSSGSYSTSTGMGTPALTTSSQYAVTQSGSQLSKNTALEVGEGYSIRFVDFYFSNSVLLEVLKNNTHVDYLYADLGKSKYFSDSSSLFRISLSSFDKTGGWILLNVSSVTKVLAANSSNDSSASVIKLNEILSVDSHYAVRPTAVYWGYVYFDIIKDGYTVSSMPVKIGQSSSTKYVSELLTVVIKTADLKAETFALNAMVV
jgi:hypothetical protein